jgi:hypothetical protein
MERAEVMPVALRSHLVLNSFRMIAALKEQFYLRALATHDGSRVKRRERRHLQLMKRAVCPSFDDRMENLNDHQRIKMDRRLQMSQQYRLQCNEGESTEEFGQ